MINSPLETSELQAFVHISDAGSVAGAARELGLPRATISRRLARLEERLGARLMHRTTRQLQLTDAGDELYQHARAIVQAVATATQAVQQDDTQLRGLLRISTPPLDDLSFRDIILSFAEQHPQIELELIVSTRHEDLIAGSIDVAWRAGVDIDPGLIARQLMKTQLIAVASPAYLARRGTPSDPKDLSQHDCLVGFIRGERPAPHWPLLDGGQIRIKGSLVSNDIRLLRDAACRGMGISLLPDIIIREDLQAGALLPVLPRLLGATSTLALVYPERRLLKPAVRVFVDFVVDWLKQKPMRLGGKK